jgi:hypothetical protein
MLDESVRHNVRHDLVGVVDALSALKAQRGGEGGGYVAWVGRCELLGGVAQMIVGASERRKVRWQ